MTSSEYQTIATALASMKNGDRDSFSEIFSLYYSRVYFICCKLLKNNRDAARVSSEILNYTYLHISSMGNPSAFEKWLYMTSVSRCRNLILASTPEVLGDYVDSDSMRGAEIDMLIQRDMDDAAGIPGGIDVSVEMMDQTDAAISGLPYKLRAAVLMKYFCGIEPGDMAASENITVPAVRNRLFTARERLMESERRFIELGYNVRGMVAFLPEILSTMAQAIVVPDEVAKEVTRSTGVLCKNERGLRAKEEPSVDTTVIREATRGVNPYATDVPESEKGMTAGVKALIIIVALLMISAVAIVVIFAVKSGVRKEKITTPTSTTSPTTVEFPVKERTTAVSTAREPSSKQKESESSAPTTKETTTRETTRETTTRETTTKASQDPDREPDGGHDLDNVIYVEE